MIYFDRIEVVNMLVPLAGKGKYANEKYTNKCSNKSSAVRLTFYVFSGGHCEKLHCRL